MMDKQENSVVPNELTNDPVVIPLAEPEEPTAPIEPEETKEPAEPEASADQAESNEGQPTVEYPAVEPITPNLDDEAEVQLALKNLEERRKRNRRKRIIKIVIVCAIIAAAIAAWAIVNAANAQKQKEEAEAAAALAALSAAAPAKTGIQASGTLKPGSSAVVTPEVSGIIQDVRVIEGQHVDRGDVLYTVKSDDAEKSLSIAQSAVDKAERGVSKAQSDVTKAQQEYDDAVNAYNSAVDTYNNSLADADAAGQAAYDWTYQQAVAAIPSTATDAQRAELLEEAELKADVAYYDAYQKIVAPDPGTFNHSLYLSSIDAANDTVSLAQDTLDDAQKDYERAQETMDKCQVKAPRSGTVLSMKAVVGAAVGGATGGTTTSHEATVTIGDLSSLEVDIEVNEIDVSGVKVGQTAEVTFPAFPDIQENAEVVSVAAAATNASSDSGSSSGGIVTFTVKLAIKQPDDRLKAGMSANVKIPTESDAAAASSSAASASSSAQSASSAAASGSAS